MTTLNSKLTHSGHIIQHYILDNECNEDFKKVLAKKDLTFELTPPNIHQRNTTERDLATCNPNFSITE